MLLQRFLLFSFQVTFCSQEKKVMKLESFWAFFEFLDVCRWCKYVYCTLYDAHWYNVLTQNWIDVNRMFSQKKKLKWGWNTVLCAEISQLFCQSDFTWNQFCRIWEFKKDAKFHKSLNFRESKCATWNCSFFDSYIHQLWFHVKCEWQNYSVIFTLCEIHYTVLHFSWFWNEIGRSTL